MAKPKMEKDIIGGNGSSGETEENSTVNANPKHKIAEAFRRILGYQFFEANHFMTLLTNSQLVVFADFLDVQPPRDKDQILSYIDENLNTAWEVFTVEQITGKSERPDSFNDNVSIYDTKLFGKNSDIDSRAEEARAELQALTNPSLSNESFIKKYGIWIVGGIILFVALK